MRTRSILAVSSVLMLVTLLALAMQPVSSAQPPAWAQKIMEETTISGLTKDGERQKIVPMGRGGWSSKVTDVWYYAVWRIQGETNKHDLQAHIELANTGNNTYLMEIYHSWTTLNVAITYDHAIVRETPHLLVIRITAHL